VTRRALLMASGANRGAYYAGFPGPLQEAGINFEILGGVSAGGIAAAWFAAGDEDALHRSWMEASRWNISFHPFFSRGRRRCVDELIRHITLKIMDLDAVLRSVSSVRIATARVCGRRWPFPKLERKIFEVSDLRTTKELALVLRATAFVPWINGLRASVEIGGERYLDGGLVGRIPLEMVRPGEVDEIWVAACSPNGRRELEEELRTGRPERIVVITPSETLPVGRWTMDRNRIFQAIALGRKDMETIIKRYRRTGDLPSARISSSDALPAVERSGPDGP